MSVRWRVWSPWLGWMALWGCLNPQPDTGPLSTGPVAPAPALDGNAGQTPALTPPGSPTDGPNGFGDEDPAPPSEGLVGTAPDAGVAPSDAGGPIPPNPAVSTFSATDAGLLDPDAGVPPDSATD
ncbi:MAG: hypothetical protein RL685_6955 [Pseudomonadota bacterium]|jgi:hypothetical protein